MANRKEITGSEPTPDAEPDYGLPIPDAALGGSAPCLLHDSEEFDPDYLGLPAPQPGKDA